MNVDYTQYTKGKLQEPSDPSLVGIGYNHFMEENQDVADAEGSSSEEGGAESDNEDANRGKDYLKMQSIFSSISISDDNSMSVMHSQLSPAKPSL